MYIRYKDTIHIFDNNTTIENATLFIKLKEKYTDFNEEKINTIINIYNGITIYKCKYSNKLENEIMGYCADL
jgi:hypothetical protein